MIYAVAATVAVLTAAATGYTVGRAHAAYLTARHAARAAETQARPLPDTLTDADWQQIADHLDAAAGEDTP